MAHVPFQEALVCGGIAFSTPLEQAASSKKRPLSSSVQDSKRKPQNLPVPVPVWPAPFLLGGVAKPGYVQFCFLSQAFEFLIERILLQLVAQPSHHADKNHLAPFYTLSQPLNLSYMANTRCPRTHLADVGRLAIPKRIRFAVFCAASPCLQIRAHSPCSSHIRRLLSVYPFALRALHLFSASRYR